MVEVPNRFMIHKYIVQFFRKSLSQPNDLAKPFHGRNCHSGSLAGLEQAKQVFPYKIWVAFPFGSGFKVKFQKSLVDQTTCATIITSPPQFHEGSEAMC